MAVELFVNDQFCPIKEDDDNRVTITRNIADIAEPDTRTGDYAKGFTVVGTPETNKLFGQLFEVNLDIQNTSTTNFNPDFNPNLKAKCTVMVDQQPVFRGDLMLRDIIITREEKIEYVVEAFSNIRNFFNDVGEGLLTDLDYSDLQHTWDATEIQNSWNYDYTDGYVYPMVDYGDVSNKSQWYDFNFKPAIFARYIWDKIFAAAGWGYSSDFIDTNDFSRQIIVSNGKAPHKLQSQIDDETFTAGRTSSQALTILPYGSWRRSNLSALDIVEFNSVSGTLSNNTLSNTSLNEYSTSTYRYTVSDDIRTALRFYLDGNLEYTGASATTQDKLYALRIYVLLNGSIILDSFALNFIIPSGTTNGTQTQALKPINATIPEFDLYGGDYVDVRVGWLNSFDTNGTNQAFVYAPVDFTFNLDAGALFGNVPDDIVRIGETITPNYILPKDMKQRDFIMAYANMFNLYFEQTNEKTLLIEPRDNGYYRSGDQYVHNWTDKLDISQGHVIKPMGYLDARRYIMKNKDGKDYLSRKYDFQFGLSYGEKIYEVTNDFQKEDKTIEIPFYTSVLSNDPNENDRLLTNVQYFDDQGQQTQPAEEIRSIYWGGLIDTNDQWTLYFTNFAIAATKTNYPYAGHLDSPVDPTTDFLFSYPRAVYYDITSGQTQYNKYTNNNLFSKYYSKFIYEITDKNSKTLEGWFYIDPTEWQNISFRDLYFIKDSYWRLLEINDHDPSGENLTYCKFLKTAFASADSTDQATIGGEQEWVEQEGEVVVLEPLNFRDNNLTRVGLKRNEGKGNRIAAPKGIIRGDFNNITQEGFLLINASGNTSTQTGTTLINTNGREIIYENDVWINDINLERKVEFTLDAGVITALDTTPYPVLPQPESEQYWDITRIDAFYDYNGVSYTGGANLEFQTDGASSGTNTTLYDDVGTPILAESADKYEKFVDQTTVDLNDRVGDGVQLVATSAIGGIGGDIRFTVYARLVEV